MHKGSRGPSSSTGVVSSPTQGSGRPPGGPGWVERPTQRSGRVREDYPEVLEELGVPVGLGGVKRPIRCSGRGRQAQPEDRVGLKGPPSGLEEFRRTTRRSGKSWEAHQ